MLLASATASPAEVYPANAVKAAFLSRFAGYIAWPPGTDTTRQFVIAVWGADDVARELERIASQVTPGNRPFEVRRVHSPRELGEAQLVYCGPGHRPELRRVSTTTVGKPVLVVSDDEEGLEDGSAINLVQIDRRIRFEVSISALQRNGLKASSELLALAARVQNTGTNANQSGGSP